MINGQSQFHMVNVEDQKEAYRQVFGLWNTELWHIMTMQLLREPKPEDMPRFTLTRTSDLDDLDMTVLFDGRKVAVISQRFVVDDEGRTLVTVKRKML